MMAKDKALDIVDTFVKNVALSTAFSKQKLTLRKHKALHILALTIREQFFARHPHYTPENIHTITKKEIEDSKSIYEVGEEQVMMSMGYDNKRGFYSLNQVLNIFAELSKDPVYFDGLGIVNRATASDTYSGFFRPLGQVERDNGFFKFHVPPMMVYYVIRPEVSLNAPISWTGYRTKFSPLLYETCLYYYQNGEAVTDYFPIETLRQITDTSDSSTYDKVNNFKERVIDRTLASINSSEELNLHISYETASLNPEKRRGRRTITHMRFHIKEKTSALSKKVLVRDSIVLSTMRAEIERFGVPSHAVDSVLAECQDKHGEICVPYVKWTVKRAHEIRQLKKFSLAESNASDKKHNFGGYYRQKIVRDRKSDWFKIRDLIQSKMHQDSRSTSSLKSHENEQRYEHIDQELKRIIACRFLQNFEEYTFAKIYTDFSEFLKVNIPSAYESLVRGDYSESLTEMAESGNPHLMFYLDYAYKIFIPDSYQSVLYEDAISRA